MGKCKCSIYGGSPMHTRPQLYTQEPLPKGIEFPMNCTECGDEVSSFSAGIVIDARITHPDHKTQTAALCHLCREITHCFFCTSSSGATWGDIKQAIKRDQFPLGDLTGMLSEKALNKLLTKVDEWMENGKI